MQAFRFSENLLVSIACNASINTAVAVPVALMRNNTSSTAVDVSKASYVPLLPLEKAFFCSYDSNLHCQWGILPAVKFGTLQ